MIRRGTPWLALLTALLCQCTLDRQGMLDGPGAPPGGQGGALLAGPGGAGGGVVSSSASSTASSASVGGAGGSGGSVVVPECGNGVVEPPSETCDDGDDTPDDGCTSCQIDEGYQCDDEPSQCQPIPPQVVSLVSLNETVADDGSYDGSIASMACIDVNVVDLGFDEIQSVELTVAIDHPYLGDLIIKVVSPSDKVVTVLSRAGVDEPADDYHEPNGDSSDLSASDPITFLEDGATDAEDMGDSINGNLAACGDDTFCEYDPNPGAGPGTGLGDFVDDSPAGNWQVCVADGDTNDQGTVKAVTLTILSW